MGTQFAMNQINLSQIDLKPGFSDPVFDSQASFRRVLNALARPGRIETVEASLTPPDGLGAAMAAFCLTVIDVDTPLWLDTPFRTPEIAGYLKFHCGCPVVDDPADAAFALATGADLPPLDRFNPGDGAYPERSTTVIAAVSALSNADDGAWALSGPGIEAEHRLSVGGLRDITPEWRDNALLFPCGVDLVLTCDRLVVGLPRTVTIETV